MVSLTRWTWVWVGSGSWLWTERPGVLQSMRSQRVGHNWVTELNWSTCKSNGSEELKTALKYTAVSSLILHWMSEIRREKLFSNSEYSIHLKNKDSSWNMDAIHMCASSFWFNLGVLDVWWVVRNHGKVWPKHRGRSFWLSTHCLNPSAGFSQKDVAENWPKFKRKKNF